MRALLPVCRESGTRLVTNMGVANPAAAAEKTLAIARELGLGGLRIACIQGDDVSHLLGPEYGALGRRQARRCGDALVGANAYLGIEALLPAFAAEGGCHHQRTRRRSLALSRRSRPSSRLGNRRLAASRCRHACRPSARMRHAGHRRLLRRSGPQGGSRSRPLRLSAGRGRPGWTLHRHQARRHWRRVDLATVKEQLLYEVHDPSRYLTPDVTADFSGVRLEQTGRDRVRVEGASGSRRPPDLKVTVGFDGGLVAEAGISYAGSNALARAELARSILEERLAGCGGELRIDLVGSSSLHATAHAGRRDNDRSSEDVRVRAAMRTADRETAETCSGGRGPALLRPRRLCGLSRQHHPVHRHPQCGDRPLASADELCHGDGMKKLADIAHARAGDKGNSSNVAFWVHDEEDYADLCRSLTAERLHREFPKLLLGRIDIHPMPQLHGLNIVMHEALEGGVNTSLNLDGHGKSWSSLLLDLAVIDPD
ncbi:MAG: acyclic terpene utilization AtuA family protein [Geminicoccaceae bacterium]